VAEDEVIRRNETPAERADRNFNDLLQELRVTQTGVQVLFSLLLTVPFTARFEKVTDFQKDVYFVALLCLTLTTVLLFVTDVLFDNRVASITAAVFAGATVSLWFVPPLRRRATADARVPPPRQSAR
jgi:Na+/melibiose symporter-like transporter